MTIGDTTAKGIVTLENPSSQSVIDNTGLTCLVQPWQEVCNQWLCLLLYIRIPKSICGITMCPGIETDGIDFLLCLSQKAFLSLKVVVEPF